MNVSGPGRQPNKRGLHEVPTSIFTVLFFVTVLMRRGFMRH